MLSLWDFAVLGVASFMMLFMMLVGFLRDVDWVIGKARQHQNLLRRLLIPKLIGVSILLPSILFGLLTTQQIVLSPDGFVGSLPTMGLCLLGTWVGIEIVFPTNGQGL